MPGRVALSFLTALESGILLVIKFCTITTLSARSSLAKLLHLSSPNFHPQCSFHFTFSLLTLGLALVQISSAAPAPAGALSKRTVENLPPGDQFIECPGYRYSRAQVENAIQRLLSHLRQQPQVFALECQGKKLYEFPIPHEDSVYGGGGPGADRAVFFI
ncbi:uncharacterized protein BDW43DRAFT_306070 [Aspergillus alliaceus]|uniref:uncharacterized protein n=1 Tax=Petromyces alliaceus TaxID=209559 RepID=UPI0012A58185|nr:uncharacterized protein BDW43DRAFT_306070 [Aspergillus alliaceus]KAB8239186.1 hypothetical protein BDW43DRAFT_306070 [Aspergillus alliaceus]